MSEPDRACEGQGCDNPAVVQLTQVVDNQSSTHYLCRDCAREKGIGAEPPSSIDVTDFLAQLGGSGSSRSGGAEEPCSFCTMTFDDFRESGRLGCPHCYTTFERRVRRLLSRIHSASQHAGKVYLPPDPSAAEVDRRISGLRRSLQHAIDAEDFERAAVLRDLIRSHETAES